MSIIQKESPWPVYMKLIGLKQSLIRNKKENHEAGD